MDRNFFALNGKNVHSAVATREGGVDRNADQVMADVERITSPPARVAWIETV